MAIKEKKATSKKTTAKTTSKSIKKAKADIPAIARLKAQYNDIFSKELKDELKLDNINEVPKLTKIVLNAGLGKAREDKKILETASNTLAKITGQVPVTTAARMSIATFKLREGDKIGAKVTLRGDRMYEFTDRIINIILPRLRDFHGVSNRSFDSQGNYSLGLRDQTVFPELSYEETSTPHGMQIIFVIEAKEPAHAKALLTKFGMPFMKEGK